MAESRRRGAVEDEKDPYGHPRIPYRGYYDRERCDLRRKWVERFTSCSLAHVGQWWEGEGQDDSCSCLKLKGNVENLVGLVKVPLGVAGPLFVRGKHVSGYVLLPFATTEGALVASATRGAAALTRAGGVSTLALEQRMIRSPMFITRNSGETVQLWRWLQNNFDPLQKQVRLFSQHATLASLTPTFLGKTLVVSFIYTTCDAAGQNMVTTATWNACKWALRAVEKDLPRIRVTEFYIESLLSGDKRAAPVTLTATRGVHVQAEAWIPESVLQSTLKVDLRTLLSTYNAMMEVLHQMVSIGTGINFGNVIAGSFIATGQDAASVSESANGLLIVRPATKEEIETQGWSTGGLSSTEQIQQLELMNGDYLQSDKPEDGAHYAGVYACVVLPSLVLGTVGGGTSLATQKECLAMMGCHGKGDIFRFAEIVAGFALALDLSTLAAIASGQFATAHEKLGRNRPSDGLKPEHLDVKFFQSVVGSRGEVDTWNPIYVHTGNSILSELTKNEMSKRVGHFGFHVKFKEENGKTHTLPVVLKSKPTDIETSNMINKMAQGCGLKLASVYEKHKMDTGFRFCSVREVEICHLENPTLKRFMPTIYHTLLDSSKSIYIIVMEYLSKDGYTLLNTADDISDWTLSDIKVVLRDMAHIHSLFLNQTDWFHSRPWLEHTSGKEMAAMAPLWTALVAHAHHEFPEMWTTERTKLIQRAINNIPSIWSTIDSAPHTMVHNDFNPRNTCIHKVPDHTHSDPHSSPQTISSSPYSGQSHHLTLGDTVPFSDPRYVCIYDWELATITVPQRDLVEFLSFTLQPSSSTERWLELIDFYRQHLEFYSKVAFPADKFIEVFHASCFHFAMKRLSMYTMAHTYKDYRFLPRVVNSLFSFLTAQFEREDFRPRLIQVISKL